MASTLRLAVSHHGRRSRYWTFKPTKKRVGVYISREGTPGGAHVSLHADKAWHLKVDGGYYQLPIAKAIESTGVRHAVSVVVGKSACRIETTMPTIELLELEPDRDDDVCIAIDVLMLSAGGHVFATTDNGVQPRWELPLPDGHSAHVLARALRTPSSATVSIDAPPDVIADIRAGLVGGTIDQMLVLGSQSGGPVTIIDAEIQPSA